MEIKKLIPCLLLFAYTHTASWKPGIDVLTAAQFKQLLPAYKKPRIGLITNHTGMSLHHTRTVDALRTKAIDVQVIFAPEHGMDGRIELEKEVPHTVDNKTSIPVISLYKGNGPARITSEDASLIDAFIFDIQDSGMRHYTYVSTLFHVIEAAAEYKKPLIILDRPNPLGGIMEGPLVDNKLISFISIASIPLRHGMTFGELAIYFNNHVVKKRADIKVVPIKNYQRNQGLAGVWLSPLSPNIPTLQSCLGYSFLGLLSEVRPFDMAIRTHHAFRCLLLPDALQIPRHSWFRLHFMLKKNNVKSQAYRYFNPKKKQWYSGLFLYIPDIQKVSAMKTFIAITDFFKKEGLTFTFGNSFDKAAGTSHVRMYIEGNITKKQLAQEINNGLKDFYKKAASSFLYKPAPTLMLL